MKDYRASRPMYTKRAKGRSTEITVNLHETNQQLAYWDKNIPNITQYSSLVGFLSDK